MSSTVKAALWMIGAIVSFSSMAVAGREVAYALDTFEIMMYRSLIGLFVVCLVLTATSNLHVVKRDKLGTHVIRNLAHFSGQNLWLYAVTAIPLAQVFALEFTSPLWVLVLSPLVLGDRLTRMRSLCALVGFFGILVVARPSPETINPGGLAAAAAALFFATSFGLAMIADQQYADTEELGFEVPLESNEAASLAPVGDLPLIDEPSESSGADDLPID